MIPVEAYLDHAASTPARPEVVEAMLPWLAEHPGNPSGAHRLAREARRALAVKRDDLRRALRKARQQRRLQQAPQARLRVEAARRVASFRVELHP